MMISRQVSANLKEKENKVSLIAEQQILMKHWIVWVQYLTYFPDLVPHNFFWFPKQKIHPIGKRFEDMRSIKRDWIEESVE